uniref:TATA element modulatory factor 1 n=1 Tax=Latimeria chalumnae TaxID=7897 RepID=H3B2M8_LATCH
TGRMSWFNASQLSSFAKQALSQAQKSIDRVLDIKEDENSWPDTIIAAYDDEKSSSSSGGWGNPQWNSVSEKRAHSQPVSSPTAITTPVTRTVVDESENFFGVFLSPTDVQSIQKTPVVSKPPAKSQRPKEVKNTQQDSLKCSHSGTPVRANSEIKFDALDGELNVQKTSPENSTPQKIVPKVSAEDEEPINKGANKDQESSVPFKKAKGNIEGSTKNSLENESTINNEPLGSPPHSPLKSHTTVAKAMVLDNKEHKSEDRQSNTPSPPVSTFSSGTSTTSDIEVLDHESVISESSASSRQEAVDSKASLHLMQTSFQLLSASACAEYPRLDDYQKLSESCSSSDAFERIDSFSMQSLDSRSVSEINSDDELSGRGYTLASVTVNSSASNTMTVDQADSKLEEVNETLKDYTFEEAEMEESGRSATPVNSEQPEDLVIPVETIDEAENVVSEKTEHQELQIGKNQSTMDDEEKEQQKVITELLEKLEKRETQLLSVSKEKARLEEAYDNLKDEMTRLQEESSSTLSLKEEFTHRIAEAEKKVQMACKERDAIKKELKGVREELATRLNSDETAELLKEKDEQIKGLMEEGEKLSKQQLHNSNIIKKLRAKEKETEGVITKQTKKIKELEEETQHLRQILDGKEELELQHRENIKKLNIVVERLENELSNLQTDTDELQERNRSLQAALDNSYKELAELHRANATKDSEAQEAALSCEMKAREELSLALEKVKDEARQQQETLAIQVTDLRLALQRAEQQQARKEDYLRQEIAELQQRLQDAENRNQELSQSVTSATRPLLRQIENLQATLGAQTSAWEKLEKNLSDRLVEAQAQLAAAVEKERAATEDLLTIKAQVSSFDSQNSLLRHEKSRLQAQLEVEKTRLEKSEDESHRYLVELENLKADHIRLLEEAKKEKALLINQLEMEKIKVEQEKKKTFVAQEASKEKERKAFVHSPMEPTSSTPSLSRSSSVSGIDMTGLQTSSSFFSQEDIHDHSFGPMSVSASGSNLYDALRMGVGSSIVENLQSQLKLKEGEIVQLQLEIANLEKTRSIMAEELVKLTNQNDELEDKVKEIPKLRAQLRDLDQRYNTILQMYGEKAEESEELRLDLEDVKNMYKTQIDELLKQRLS